MTISGAVMREGVAYTPDGALYVQHTDGATQANSSFTGTPDFTGADKIKGVAQIIAQWNIPFVYIDTGSIADNGALTLVSVARIANGEGAYCYFPANAIAAGVAAGWYWTVFSGTTAGTIYNSTYTSGVPTAGTTTAFATTGPGAFTSTTAEIQGPTITVPANAMGPNGRVIAWQLGAADTVNYTARIRYSGFTGTIVCSQVSTGAFAGSVLIGNRGSAAVQVAANHTAAGVGNTIVNPHLAVDTTAATTVVYTLEKSGATSSAVLEAGEVLLSYKA